LNFTKTPYLVLFIVLGAVGVGTASALITITFEGIAVFKEDVQMDKDLNVDGTVTGDGTLGGLGCSIDQVARWTGTEWICTTISVITDPIIIVDSADEVGEFSSLALASGDKPVISYLDTTNDDLKLAICDDASCSSSTIRTVDSSPDQVGSETSIALASGDKPVISYYDGTNGNLKLAICDDASCSSSTIRTVDSSSDQVGFFTSIALASGDKPVISYYDFTNKDLKLAACVDASCSSSTIRMVDSTADEVGEYTSIALASGDKPVISYFDNTNDDLKVALCHDPTCSSSSKRIVDSEGEIGQFTSVTILLGTRPVISYYDITNGDLKLAVCNDANCFSPIIRTVDTPNQVGSRNTSVELDSSNKPVISYADVTILDLKLALEGSFVLFN